MPCSVPGKLETGFWTQLQTQQAEQVQFIVLPEEVTIERSEAGEGQNYSPNPPTNPSRRTKYKIQTSHIQTNSKAKKRNLKHYLSS